LIKQTSAGGKRGSREPFPSEILMVGKELEYGP
jgi:hypothetical protein